MKPKNYILVIITILFFSISNHSQEKKTSKDFDVININGTFKKNQLLLEFLSRNSRFTSKHLKKLIKNQRNYNSDTFETQNLRNNKKFGTQSSSLTIIYYNNKLILGEGINRLYLVDNVRLKSIKRISKNYSGLDKVIKITTL